MKPFFGKNYKKLVARQSLQKSTKIWGYFLGEGSI